MTEYKKYDSTDVYENKFARLTKDAEKRELPGGKVLARISFVSTGRGDNDEDMWFEATPGGHQTNLALFLRKGDVIGVEGKPTMRRFGDKKEKVAFAIKRAELHIPPDMFARLKERGWNPQAQTPATTKPTKSSKPAPAKKPPADMPDLDDDIPF